jgi:hypothetical protein
MTPLFKSRLISQGGGVYMLCPKCKSRSTGKIGHNQYYCWDCSIEFVPTSGGVRMYRLEPDGSVMPEPGNSVAQAFLTGVRESQLNMDFQSDGQVGQEETDSSKPEV